MSLCLTKGIFFNLILLGGVVSKVTGTPPKGCYLGVLHKVSIKGTTSDGLLHGPYKCTKTEHLVVFIKFLETCEKRLDLPIFHDSEDGTVH